MPSPIGHALAGAAVAWTLAPRNMSKGLADDLSPHLTPGLTPDLTPCLTLACVALAIAPDLDLFVPASHRSFTHSIGAIAVVIILSIVVTGKVTNAANDSGAGKIPWRIVLACVAAYSSHLLMDWMAADRTAPRGIRLLWPFSDAWYISEWDVFRGTARRSILTMTSMRANALAVAQEIAIMAPIAWAAWLIRVKALTRFPPEMPRRHQPPQ
jgi:membrane-bound metal-dependent hydrolase YbcI (DUF457 family)